MLIKLDKSEASFKQFEYFFMASWKKIKILTIINTSTHGETFCSLKIQNGFEFPLLQELCLQKGISLIMEDGMI